MIDIARDHSATDTTNLHFSFVLIGIKQVACLAGARRGRGIGEIRRAQEGGVSYPPRVPRSLFVLRFSLRCSRAP